MWKSILGGDEEQQDNILDDQEGLCAISPLQCFIVFAKPIKFGLLFTFGNLLAVGRVSASCLALMGLLRISSRSGNTHQWLKWQSLRDIPLEFFLWLRAQMVALLHLLQVMKY